MGHETSTMRRLRAVGAVLLVLAIAALATHDVGLTRRVAALEVSAAARDKADPLLPPECEWRGPRGTIEGGERAHPCTVTFERLLEAPQQFVGRWIEVPGRFLDDARGHALFPLNSVPPTDTPWEPTDHALLVNVQPFAPPDARHRAVFVGRFRRGPTGPGGYFGALDDR